MTMRRPCDTFFCMATERPRPVTLLDVANEAGVSVSTASRALTGARRVRGDLEERVRSAVESLGYHPNEAARGLRMARTMTLGVFFHELNSPVSLDLIDGLGATAHEARYSLAVTSARGDRSLYPALFQHFYGQRVDGLILSWPHGNLATYLAPFIRAGIPAITLRSIPGEPGMPVVSADTSSGFAEAFAALAGLGHRAITLIAHGILWTPPTNRRRNLDRLTEAVGMHIRRRSSRDTGMSLCEIVTSELSSEEPPTVFLAPFDEVGEVIESVRATGKRVPEDVSVISFTDSRIRSGAKAEPLAVIDVDSFELGRRIAAVTLDAIENGIPAQDVRIPGLARWVPGATVGPAPQR
ncbi:MAG: LacI family transcriptional regulator [Dehalococcoidia bacterium]|nr:MAG: LacI family transcriptional regulator [Dehalococcoidia bacterium]